MKDEKEQWRPDPDKLLESITEQEEQSARGRLKIFFGMCAGVGKTYAMLHEAQELKKAGVDIVIGYVETHKRPETEALTVGLPTIQRRKLNYRDVTLEEMNLEAIIERKPRIVLVDELAHTNVPGSLHAKRWQDVVEILNNGISVFTTINVQHIESRSDTVREITGITVSESVPDSILDLADEIELIDISTEELLKRLSEGKVYMAEKAGTAARNFFRVGNLTALREMSLRVTAERVDKQLRDYMQKENISGPWKSGERLMVAVGPSPYSANLIRWTRRLAYSMKAQWLVVHIENDNILDDDAKEQLAKNIALAKELGGEVVSTPDSDIVTGLLRAARQNNVSQIIIGKPLKQSFFDYIRRTNIVDRLILESGDIDIYVVRAEKQKPAKHRIFSFSETRSGQKDYLLAALIIAIVALVCFPLKDYIGYQSVGLLMLFTVILLPLFFSRGPILLAGFLSALTWNYFFIPPLFTFHIERIEDIITLCLNFTVAIVTGFLTSRIKRQERTVRHREERAIALYNLTNELSKATSTQKVIEICINHLRILLKVPVVFLLSDKNGKLNIESKTDDFDSISEKEITVATWVMENNRIAGRYTDNLPSSEGYYLPVATPRGIIGVIGLYPNKRLSMDQEAMLNNFIAQTASSYERELSEENSRKMLVMAESEKLYKTFINSVSHEFRTPIAIIQGASGSLQDDKTITNSQTVKILSSEILSATKRMNRLVENLLNTTRLEAGSVNLNMEWHDAGDIIYSSVNGLKQELANHIIKLEIENELPLVRADFGLLTQAIANILQNAAAYTPQGTEIKIQAYIANMNLNISIQDKGSGIPEAEIEKIFDKFYRVEGTKAGGTGLGLSIAKGFVEAHGGKIMVENVYGGGARFIISLPLNNLQ